MAGLLTGYCHLKGYLNKLELVNSPQCGRCKYASETASHVLEAVAASSTWVYILCNWVTYEEISVSRILNYVQGAGLLDA